MTPYAPAASVVLGKLNVTPLEKWKPVRFNGDEPVFFTSMNSKSCAVYGLPAPGAGGLYINSVMRSVLASKLYTSSAIALQTPPPSERARMWVVLLSASAPL